jgi:hypothetical protein
MNRNKIDGRSRPIKPLEPRLGGVQIAPLRAMARVRGRTFATDRRHRDGRAENARPAEGGARQPAELGAFAAACRAGVSNVPTNTIPSHKPERPHSARRATLAIVDPGVRIRKKWASRSTKADTS